MQTSRRQLVKTDKTPPHKAVDSLMVVDRMAATPGSAFRMRRGKEEHGLRAQHVTRAGHRTCWIFVITRRLIPSGSITWTTYMVLQRSLAQ